MFRAEALSRLHSKRARRRPSRLHVSKIQRVQLCPENIALRPQGCNRQLLFSARVRMLSHPLQSKAGIFRRLMQAGGEVIETSRQPWIMLAQAVHSQRNQVTREQFGQRRGNRFQESAILRQIKVRIHGITYRGKTSSQRMTRWRSRPVASASLIQRSIPPSCAESPS